MHNLIEEVLVEILVRLPTKSILQFKIVCKSWHRLIKSTSFIHHHLHFINTHPPIANLIYSPGSENVFCAGSMHTWLLCKANKHIRQLNWGVVIPYNYWFSLVKNTVNGIYCLMLMPIRNTRKNDLPSMFALWNPAIRQIHILPVIPDVEEIGNTRICGFGFDSSTNDYKIIVITKGKYGHGCWFHIYSLATNRWRQLDPFKVCVKCPIIDATGHDNLVSFTATISQRDGFYFNGACHWYSAFCNHHGWKDKRILSFNFKDEIIRGYKVSGVICCEELHLITEVIGCLAVVCSVKEPNFQYQVWVMREYGVDSSWFKAYIIPTKVSDLFIGIDDDEFYVKEDSGQLVSYRLNAPEDISVYEYCRLPYSFQILPYCESLVPVKPPFI